VRPAADTLAAADVLAAHLRATAQWTDVGVSWPSDFNPGQPLAGYSHGASGIASALSRLDRVRGDRTHREYARAAVRFERTLFDPDAGNWRDVRSFVPEGSSMVAWCHGAGGIGLARAELAMDGPNDPQVDEDLAVALDTLLREGLDTGNQCICHGDLGNAEAVVTLGRHADDASAVDAGLRAATTIAGRVVAGDWVCGVPLGVETPGLMPGLAGIGYNLLRLASPRSVPSVLLLEEPRTGRLG
jgi:lantibiotic modifying enzyme